MWIAGTWRRILITITGFTLAHSATLILSALNVVRLPIPPVEAAIALSIVFLATEIVRGPRQSLTWRYPIAVSSSFGLLHGFGFAAALNEIGLPQSVPITKVITNIQDHYVLHSKTLHPIHDGPPIDADVQRRNERQRIDRYRECL